jgi:hypothetical protein
MKVWFDYNANNKSMRNIEQDLLITQARRAHLEALSHRMQREL